MKKTVTLFIFGLVIVSFITACWNPSVKETAITAPWDKMNLPVKQDARVWASDDKKLKVVHKAAIQDVAKAYLDALEKDGWKKTKQDIGSRYVYEFEKDGQKISLDVYEFENTGVIIEKK
jgi:Holliday junction resolvase RusA-like endonuclease